VIGDVAGEASDRNVESSQEKGDESDEGNRQTDTNQDSAEAGHILPILDGGAGDVGWPGLKPGSSLGLFARVWREP